MVQSNVTKHKKGRRESREIPPSFGREKTVDIPVLPGTSTGDRPVYGGIPAVVRGYGQAPVAVSRICPFKIG